MIKEQNEKMALMQEEISDLKKQVTSLNEKITSKKKNGNIYSYSKWFICKFLFLVGVNLLTLD